MSMGGAIEAGKGFISFYADASRLVADIKTLGAESSRVAAQISADSSQKIAGGFRAAQMSVSSIAGGLLNMGRIAGKASTVLFGASFILKRFGVDTSGIDRVQAVLSKIGWAAWGVNTALKAVTMTSRALSAVAALPGRIAGGIGRGASRAGLLAGAMLPSFGGAGSAASPAEEGVSEGAQKSGGGFMAGLSGVITGLAIAGPIGAAAALLGAFIAGQFARGAEGGSGFFAQLANRAGVWSAWFMGIWNQIYGTIQSTFFKSSAAGESFLTKFEKALIPLTYAIQNVWVPAFISGIEYIGSFFKSNTESMGRTWSEFVLDNVSALAEFVGNIDLYFQIAQQQVVIFAANAILGFEDLWTNIGVGLEWLANNWQGVLSDIANMTVTYVTNMAKNWGNLFVAITNFAMGKGFDFKAVNPLEGFESSISEMPQFVHQAAVETTDEMDRLLTELGKRQQAASEKGALIEGVKSGQKMAKAKAEEMSDGRFAAVSAQSADAMSAVARFQNQDGAIKQQIDLQKKQLTETQKLVKAVERGANWAGGDSATAWSIA